MKTKLDLKCNHCGKPIINGKCKDCSEKDREVMQQQEMYHILELKNQYKWLLRERKHRIIDQLNNGVWELDKEQDYRNKTPKFVLQNTLERLEFNLMNNKTSLLSNDVK